MAEDPERAGEATSALFAGLVEPLGDLFEPRLTEVYADLFSDVCARVLPDLDAARLYGRYYQIRRLRPFRGFEPAKVFVLSRITLGADVAVTSVLLDAAKKRFPHAQILFVGPQKNYDLFADDPRIFHAPFVYRRRGALRDRLMVWSELRALLDDPAGIVIDPDSRLTQLGLLPVCSDDRYYFFESRAFGGHGNESLRCLAGRWASATFGVTDAEPFVAPKPVNDSAEITVSFGTGENDAKRIPGLFEAELLRALAATSVSVLIDKGPGGEEAERVDQAIECAGFPKNVRTWTGPFAPFAARIAASSLYVGYDSSGQHVAAASGVPLVTVFAGFASERTLARWKPTGRAPVEIVRGDNGSHPADVLRLVTNAVHRLLLSCPGPPPSRPAA